MLDKIEPLGKVISTRNITVEDDEDEDTSTIQVLQELISILKDTKAPEVIVNTASADMSAIVSALTKKKSWEFEVTRNTSGFISKITAREI